MKNLKSITIIALMLISSILFVNCEKESVEIQEQSLTPELIGELHNKAMDNFKNNYSNKNNYSGEKLTEDIIQYNMSFLKNKAVEKSIKLNNEFNLERHKELFNTDELAHKSFYKVSSKYSSKNFKKAEEDYNLYQKVNFIYDNKLINSNEKELLTSLIKYHQQNYEKVISDIELRNKVIEIENTFKNSNPNYENPGTYYVAASIEIAKNSNEWWAENLYSTQQGKNIHSKALIAPWVAADIIGGAANGLMNIFEQGAANGFKGKISAGNVGWAVLKGAVSSSVAPWSKIAKLF